MNPNIMNTNILDPKLNERKPFLIVLTVLLFAFIARVLAQLTVLLFHPGILPPMHLWQSGLLPYPLLLFFQILIILLFGKVVLDFAAMGGKFARPSRKLAQELTRWGTIYLGSMMARYSFLLCLHKGNLLPDGIIPTFFHWVLASFLLVLAQYHHNLTKRGTNAGI